MSTPGPWTIDKVNENCIKVRDHAVVAECTTAGRWDNTRTQVITPEECLANAHLIAAAPDLFEALENLMAQLDPHDYPDEQNAGRAAIAKARGQG